MHEKTITKGEKYSIKKIRNIIWIVGGLIGTLILLLIVRMVVGETVTYANWLSASDSLKEAWGSYGVEYFLRTYGFASAIGGFLFAFIVGAIFYNVSSKIELTVTNKRVYGITAFGKRVDLPLDMISAIGTSWFKGVAVTTASGAIKFRFIKNRDEIHREISKLLVERQNKPAPVAAIKQDAPPQSNAEEIKKFKELLDSGIITQEEFDAKKKQLLGL